MSQQNKISLKNIVSKGRFDFSCSYGMLILITFFAIGFLIGQFSFALIVITSGLK